MSEPSITVWISTLGADTLHRALDSIKAQRLTEADVVLVVVDRPAIQHPETHTCGDPEPDDADDCDTCKVVRAYNADPPAVWAAFHHEDHCWGHPQRNWLIDRHLVSTDLIVGIDDDDVFNPGAFDAIRARATENPGRVLLFRFITWQRNILPAPGVAKEAHIGGHSIVVPNEPALVGRWGRRYAGDWDFIDSTIRLHRAAGREPVWCQEIISTARPGDGGQLRNAHDMRLGAPGPDSVCRIIVSRGHPRLGATLERVLAEQRPGDEVVLVCAGEQTPAMSCAVELAARGLSVIAAEIKAQDDAALRAIGAAMARAPRLVHLPEES